MLVLRRVEGGGVCGDAERVIFLLKIVQTVYVVQKRVVAGVGCNCTAV